MPNDNDLAPTPDAPWGWAISRKGIRYKLPPPRTEAEKAAAHATIMNSVSAMKNYMKKYSFRDRGLSDRTAEALVKHGLDAPERLLFVSEREIEKIPGMGKAAINEIRGYRERFITTEIPQGAESDRH